MDRGARALVCFLVASAPSAAAAQCLVSGDGQVCTLIADGDEAHRAAVQGGSPRGPGRDEDPARGHRRALERYRLAAERMGAPTHYDLLGRIARELADLGRLDDALSSAQECVAQTETDLEHPDRAADDCAAPAALPPFRQRVCQTWRSCMQLVQFLHESRRDEAGGSARFGFVQVQTPASRPQGFHAFLAGNDLPMSFRGRAFPVTPGVVVVEATAPGYVRFRRELTVAAGATEVVDVTLEPARAPEARAEDEPTPLRDARALLATVAQVHRRVEARLEAGAADACLGAQLDALDPLLVEARGRYARLRGAFLASNAVRHRDEIARLRALRDRAAALGTLADRCALVPATPATGAPSREGPAAARGIAPGAWWLLGGGAALLATSAVFFVLRQGAIDDLDARCRPTRQDCPESARALDDRGRAYTSAGNVLLFTGGVAVLSAGAWILASALAPPRARTTVEALVLTPGAGAWLLGLRGRY